MGILFLCYIEGHTQHGRAARYRSRAIHSWHTCRVSRGINHFSSTCVTQNIIFFKTFVCAWVIPLTIILLYYCVRGRWAPPIHQTPLLISNPHRTIFGDRQAAILCSGGTEHTYRMQCSGLIHNVVIEVAIAHRLKKIVLYFFYLEEKQLSISFIGVSLRHRECGLQKKNSRQLANCYQSIVCVLIYCFTLE